MARRKPFYVFIAEAIGKTVNELRLFTKPSFRGEGLAKLEGLLQALESVGIRADKKVAFREKLSETATLLIKTNGCRVSGYRLERILREL